MKTINVEGKLGVATGMKFQNGGQVTINLAALDIATLVDSLQQLNSSDDKFNAAVKVVVAKLYRVNCNMLADIHISSNRITFEHHIRDIAEKMPKK